MLPHDVDVAVLRFLSRRILTLMLMLMRCAWALEDASLRSPRDLANTLLTRWIWIYLGQFDAGGRGSELDCWMRSSGSGHSTV